MLRPSSGRGVRMMGLDLDRKIWGQVSPVLLSKRHVYRVYTNHFHIRSIPEVGLYHSTHHFAFIDMYRSNPKFSPRATRAEARYARARYARRGQPM